MDTPEKLLAHLHATLPKEQPVFSHGDLCDTNVFVDAQDQLHFIDLGRGGIAETPPCANADQLKTNAVPVASGLARVGLRSSPIFGAAARPNAGKPARHNSFFYLTDRH